MWVRFKSKQCWKIGDLVLVVIAAWYSEQDAPHTTWADGSDSGISMGFSGFGIRFFEEQGAI